MSGELKEGHVVDIKNKEGLKKEEAKNAVNESFRFDEFDKKIEQSFQKFVEGIKKNELVGQNASRDTLQKLFNQWLDGEYKDLDAMEFGEIEQAVIKPTDFELVRFETLKDLDDLENEVKANVKNKNNAEDVNPEIKGNQLKMKTFGISPNDIAKLFNENNFYKKKDLLTLLETAKTKKDNSSDEIKKFQRIIVGIKDPDSSDEDLKYKGKDSVLGESGVDGKFGKGTWDAFKKYIESNGTEESGIAGQKISEPKDKLEKLTPKETKKIGIKEDEEIAEKNGDPTETAPVVTPVDTPQGDNDATVNGTNRSTSSGRDVSVQYETSQTMSKENNYTRKVENAKREKEAIRRLLGLKGLSNQTKDMSYGIEGYTIKPLSDEWYNLVNLKDCLIDFQDAKDQDYNLVYCFQTIFEQYQSGKDVAKIELVGKKDDQGKWIQPKTWVTSRGFNELKESYIKYKEGNGGAYFNLVMGELENLFIRGSISVNDIDDNLFRDFFNKNNYGVAKGGVDFDKLNVDFDDGEKSKDKIWYNEKGEKEFIAMLSDFNLDGRLDHNDRGYYMGLELDNIYRSVNVDFQNSELSEQVESGQSVWKNIVNFAIDYFEAIGDSDTVAELSSVNTIDELNAKLKEKKGDEGYKTLISLQTMLKDSPVPISFICKYGNKAQEMFLNELMMDEKFEEMYDKAFEELVKQGVDPQLKVGLKPAIYASYINGGIGGGLGAAYDTDNIGTLSLSLGATHMPGSSDLLYGVVVGWSQKEGFNVGEGKIKLGADVGYSTKGFLALGKADFVSGIANKKELEAMKADSVKRITVGVRGGWLGDGLYASLTGGMNYDYIEGTINKQNQLNNYLRESLAKIFDDEKFKTFFKDGKLDTTKGEEIKGFLREKLGEAGEKDAKVVDAAVENIYTGLMYFSEGLKFDEDDEQSFNIAKNRIIYQLSETYTNKYMSEHIEKDIVGLKLTNWSIGPAVFFNGNRAESIAKSAYYSLVGGLGFTKYGNTYMTETDQSEAQYENRLATGIGLDYLEGSVEDGKITQRTIDYLNDKLSIIGNYDIEKMGIRFESLDDDGAKNILYIPKDLFRGGVYMYLDPALKEYVTADDKGFKVPVNTEIALLTRSRTNSTKFDLVIGNYRKDSEATQLSYGYKYEGKPLEYDPKNQGEKVFNIETINNSLSEFSEKKSDFPLSACEKMDDGKIAFSMKDGCEVGGLELNDGRIVLPSYGKLLIEKISDGKYTASFEAGNEEKLAIEYRDGNDVVVGNEESIPLGEVFDKYKELDKIFNDIEEKLSKMDDVAGYGKYSTFMNAAANLGEGVDDILDKDDIDTAFGKLKYLIYKQLKEKIFNVLKQRFDDPKITTEEKAMIVDRFKAIFSYNDQIINPEGLEKQLDKRGTKDTYKKLHGYDESVDFPLTSNFDYRQAVKDKLTEMGKFERKPKTNLIGMTAFYRLGQNEKGRSYMMTELGGTNVLGDVTVPISENDLEDTKNWFIKNLDKSGVHKNILESALTEKIKGALKIDSIGDNGLDLEKVLRGNTIDIGGKKIKFNMNYVFYLLGECANESIGVEIGDIVIVDSGNNGDNGGDIIEIAPEQTGRRTGVYSGNVEAANRTVIQKVAQFGGSAIVGLGGGEPDPDDHTDPVDPDPDVTTDPYS